MHEQENITYTNEDETLFSKLFGFIKRHKLLTACIAVIIAACVIFVSVTTSSHRKQAEQIKQAQIGKCYIINYHEGFPVSEIYLFKEDGYARVYIKYADEDKSRVSSTFGSLEDCDEFDITISFFGKVHLNDQYVEVNDQNIIVSSPLKDHSWELFSYDEALKMQQEAIQLEALNDLQDACDYAAVGTEGFLKELQETLQPSSGITSTASDEDYITAAQSLISEHLKNPSSAIFNSAYVEETDKYGRAIVYLDVSAQNSLGGYVRSQYYVCIQSILADTYTYNSIAYSVDSWSKLEYLKIANGWNEDKTEKVDFSRFHPNTTPKKSSVEACGFTLERYEFTSKNATYIAFIEPKTQCVVASEIILSKEYFLQAPDSDISPISKAIRGTMRTTSSMLYKHEDVFSVEQGLLQDTPLFADKYCYYAIERNGNYHITVTNVQALGCDETNYWTPLSVPQASNLRTCPQCGQSEPTAVFAENWKTGDPCSECLDKRQQDDTVTTPTQPKPTNDVPYTTPLAGSVSIYSGPSYNHSFVQTVGQDGVFTIVEETYDSEGNLWGKLKSGVGWVILVPKEETHPSENPITAEFLANSLRGDYHKVIVDDSEYMVEVGFWANEKLSNVQFTSLAFDEDSYRVSEVYQTLPELTPEKPLVACVSFPGIMSVYGISFTDSSGNTRSYAIYTSGNDGSLIFEEYK